VKDYIEHAGGFTQSANTSRIIVAHRNGTFDEYRGRSFFGSPTVLPGDEIMVLPKIDVKYTQILKDFTQILFQIAVTANVVLGL
jgi:protein involved in polysaccharide export with SLBB domain